MIYHEITNQGNQWPLISIWEEVNWEYINAKEIETAKSNIKILWCWCPHSQISHHTYFSTPLKSMCHSCCIFCKIWDFGWRGWISPIIKKTKMTPMVQRYRKFEINRYEQNNGRFGRKKNSFISYQ